MRRQPLLSIALPTCNRLDSLRETVGPLLESDLLDDEFELRIFNNASTDGTTEWLAGLRHQAGLAICNQPFNVGLEGNIIAALLGSPGRYVWLMADHMVLDPASIRDFKARLPALAAQKVAFVYAVIRSFGPVLSEPFAPRPWRDLSRGQQSRFIFYTSNLTSVVVEKSLSVSAARSIYRFAGFSYPHLGLYAAFKPDTLVAESLPLTDFARSTAAQSRVPSYHRFRSRFIGYPQAVLKLRALNNCIYPNRLGLRYATGALRNDCKQMLTGSSAVQSGDFLHALRFFPWRTKGFLAFCTLLATLPRRLRIPLSSLVFGVRSNTESSVSGAGAFQVAE